jgi:prolyl-tRNA synthetase
LERARAFRDSKTKDAKTYDELKAAVESGFAFSFWCGDAGCEEKIKEETKATMRCIPIAGSGDPLFDQPSGTGVCVLCGKPATEKGIFARAY